MRIYSMDSFSRFTIGVAAIMGGIGLIVFGCLLYSLPVYLLWNWVVPSIFGLSEITIWESFGITLLSRFLFAPDRSQTLFNKETKWQKG